MTVQIFETLRPVVVTGLWVVVELVLPLLFPAWPVVCPYAFGLGPRVFDPDIQVLWDLNCADLIREFEQTQTDSQPNPTSQPQVTRRTTRASNHRTAVAAAATNPGMTPGGPSSLP